jgi:hypothetical protein
MAAKKKNKTRSKSRPAKNARQRATKAKISRKSARKKIAQTRIASRAAQKKSASRAGARSRKKKSSVSTETELKWEFQSRNLTADGMASPRQSADFEGLSRAEQADSESVDELVEEGNVFEAGAVAGVEEADDAGEKEVRTHEVPEDDVPEEYLDND